MITLRSSIINALAVRAYVEDLRTVAQVLWSWQSDDSLAAQFACGDTKLLQEILKLADELRKKEIPGGTSSRRHVRR